MLDINGGSKRKAIKVSLISVSYRKTPLVSSIHGEGGAGFWQQICGLDGGMYSILIKASD